MSKLNFSGKLDYKDKSVNVSLAMYLFREEKSYIIYCPALDLSAYGDTEEHAKDSFADVFEITIKYMLNKNSIREDLLNHGWQIKSLKQKKIKAPSFETMLKKNNLLREILQNKEYTTFRQEVGIPQFV